MLESPSITPRADIRAVTFAMTPIDEIKSKLDIIDVVSSRVSLQKSGNTYKANCPFHTERTPSFVVSPERQSWRCFGACSSGGDIFGFVMRAENMEFGDALRELAKRAGVELGSSDGRAKSNAILSANGAAAQFYRDTLASPAGQAARKYLDERGVGQSARDAFKLGFSPNSRDGLIRYLRTHDVSRKDAVAAGLVRQSEENNAVWDFFRNRLMFPIFDRDGSVAGFGARALDDSTPKYINTAATAAFDKRNTLYALNFAIPAIRRSGSAVIVEGYMDAIAAHENGYTNVVASMGTALTENQVAQLRSLARDFVLALDPDAAGQQATLRSLESSWNVFRTVISQRSRNENQSVLNRWKPPSLKIASLPAGLDPDALIRTDPARWDEAIAEASPLLDFVIPALVQRSDLTEPDSRAAVVRQVAPLINRLDQMDQYEYWGRLADALGVPLDALSAAMAGERPRRRSRRDSRAADAEPERVEVSERVLASRTTNPVEEYALSLLARNPALIDFARDADPECFSHTENRELFVKLLSSPTVSEIEETADPALLAHLRRVLETDAPDMARDRSEKALAECLRRLELQRERDKQEALAQTVEPGEPPAWEVEESIRRANARIRELQPAAAPPAQPTAY